MGPFLTPHRVMSVRLQCCKSAFVVIVSSWFLKHHIELLVILLLHEKTNVASDLQCSLSGFAATPPKYRWGGHSSSFSLPQWSVCDRTIQRPPLIADSCNNLQLHVSLSAGHNLILERIGGQTGWPEMVKSSSKSGAAREWREIGPTCSY